MTADQLVAAIRVAQRGGASEISGELDSPVRGVRFFTIRNLDGKLNGNPHDLWVGSRSGSRTIGRIYLGSKRIPRRMGDWPKHMTLYDHK